MDSGRLSNGLVRLYVGTPLIVSTVAKPFPTTLPNVVNPPFWLSRFELLSPTLKNHWLVAESGLLPSLAMAIVPRTFGCDGAYSLTTGAFCGTSVVLATLPELSATALYPPPCQIVSDAAVTDRWTNVPL